VRLKPRAKRPKVFCFFFSKKEVLAFLFHNKLRDRPMLVSVFETISFDIHGRVAVLTINRPAVLNALNHQTLVELLQAVRSIALDEKIGGAIITGGGQKAFAAGADIKELAAMTPLGAQALSHQGHALMDMIETLGKPVIAAVNGYALGGGCELAMACTVRIASETAKFGQPEVSLGLIPGYGGTQRLPRLIGKGRALQMILSGKSIDAHEARRIGLVNEVVPAAELLARSTAVLEAMMANAPVALRLAMEAVNRGEGAALAEACAVEADLFALSAATADRTEGTAAFLSKRKPVFQGA
jgi:enoyl-CoA hydratase